MATNGRNKACFFERPNQEQIRASVGDAEGVADMRNPFTTLIEKEHDPEVLAKIKPDREMVELAQLVRMAGSLNDAARLLQDRISDVKRQARRDALNAMLRYFWDNGGTPNPWEAMKRLLAATRWAAVKLIRGISESETAQLLGETRAATNARKKHVVEELLIRWGVKSYLGYGGSKSVSTREKLRKAHLGNNSRAKGERRKRAQRFKVLSTREERTAESQHQTKDEQPRS
jgi:hypothetical protein